MFNDADEVISEIFNNTAPPAPAPPAPSLTGQLRMVPPILRPLHQPAFCPLLPFVVIVPDPTSLPTFNKIIPPPTPPLSPKSASLTSPAPPPPPINKRVGVNAPVVDPGRPPATAVVGQHPFPPAPPVPPFPPPPPPELISLPPPPPLPGAPLPKEPFGNPSAVLITCTNPSHIFLAEPTTPSPFAVAL